MQAYSRVLPIALGVGGLTKERDDEIQDAALFAARLCSDFDLVVFYFRADADGTIGRNIRTEWNYHRSIGRCDPERDRHAHQ